jgi:hypothetical protein
MSEKTQNGGWTRRRFISLAIPACSVACLGGGSVWAWEDKHKFDAEYPRKMTYKDYWAARFREFIYLAKAMENEMGKYKLI